MNQREDGKGIATDYENTELKCNMPKTKVISLNA